MRREILAKAAAGGRLSREEALSAGRDLAAGRSDPLHCAAFLAALAARGETAEELAGLASAFREAVVPMRPFPEALDTCGTGGDGRRTFNLSTASALVAACLGVPVAKHGNRSVSSACGSADVLERAGVPIESSPCEAEDRLERLGFAFLFAPRFHPAMAHIGPVRRSLGVRTVFNLLGPLLNPAGARRQVVGVFDPARLPLLAEALRALGAEHALVMHGEGGYDEAVLHGRTSVLEVIGDRRERYDLGPSDFGFAEGRAADLAGGDAYANARTLQRLLAGLGPKPLRDAVAANTALALRAAGLHADLREGAGQSAEAMATGFAGHYLARLREDGREVRRERVS